MEIYPHDGIWQLFQAVITQGHAPFFTFTGLQNFHLKVYMGEQFSYRHCDKNV